MAAKRKKPAKQRPSRLGVVGLLGMSATYNPRGIDSDSLDALRASLREFGPVQPIVVNSRSNTVVGGHQRVLAAQMERIKDLPVTWVDLDPTKERRLNLALNKISGRFNKDLLGDVLREIDAEGGELTNLGFDDEELEKLLTKHEDPLPGYDEDIPSDHEAATDEQFGGATALTRGSVPWAYWIKAELIRGRVLDFGCGNEQHLEVDRYDAFTCPNVAPLLQEWDTITCNYVLNTQPADHLVIQILALINQMLAPGGHALIACITRSKDLDGTRAAGGRDTLSRDEWEEVICPVFDVERVKASGFYGWDCTPLGGE